MRNSFSENLFKTPFLYLWISIPLFFYWWTACRTPGWVDATLILTLARDLVLNSWVNTHNLFNLIGHFWLKILPFGDPHFMLVLLCAVFGSITVLAVLLVGLELCKNRAAAVMGAVTVMLCHTIWWHSTMIEVYTLNSALTALMILKIIQFERKGRYWNLYIAALLFGLGISNHVLMGLFLIPWIGLIVRRACRGHFRSFIIKASPAILFGLAGASLYLFVFIRDWKESITMGIWPALNATLHQATGGEFKKFMFSDEMVPGKTLFWRINYLVLILYNIPSLGLLLLPRSLAGWWKNRTFRLTAVFLLSALAVQILWSANYFIWDMYAFIQPVILLMIIIIIPGYDRFIGKSSIRKPVKIIVGATVLVPLLLYQALPSLSGRSENNPAAEYFKNYDFRSYHLYDVASPYWTPELYIMNPNKRRYDEVSRTAEGMFAVLPDGSYVFQSETTTDYPLTYYYRDTMSIRTDIKYQSLFGQFVTEQSARSHALRILNSMNRYEHVYTVSLNFPERMVIDQLFLLLKPNDDIQRIKRLSTEELIADFPGLEVQPVLVHGAKDFFIYRLIPEN